MLTAALVGGVASSFLAGALVFVHVGLHQVGHFTGVHLTALAVTNLKNKNRLFNRHFLNLN